MSAQQAFGSRGQPWPVLGSCNCGVCMGAGRGRPLADKVSIAPQRLLQTLQCLLMSTCGTIFRVSGLSSSTPIDNLSHTNSQPGGLKEAERDG